MKKIGVIVFMGLMVLSGYKSIDKYPFYIPKNWPKPTYDFSKNPLSEDKIMLGRALFYDPILSRDSTISCASCHSPYSAFTHIDHDLSHGIDNKIGTRNAPSLMNLAWQSSFMWDGAVNHLDMQALAPMSNPIEMDEKINHVVLKLQSSKLYSNLFYKAFTDSSITGERLLKCISQFMVTLISYQSKYDSVINKETLFTQQEENGYRLFKKNCAACHKEPLFTNNQFENNGLPLDTFLKDVGRMAVTQDSANYLQFKVPTLRNIEYSYPYMHDGRFKKLSDVLKHYTTGIYTSKTLSKQLNNPMVLSSNERVDIIAFLLTLSDKEFVFSQKYNYPKKIF
jgi:cytochrome c peroxidase